MKASQIVNQSVAEGIHDPHIFKAVFTSGSPAAGKSTVIKSLGLLAMGFKLVTSDQAFEMMLDRAGLDPRMPPEEELPRLRVRQRAKEIEQAQLKNYLAGRLALLIDGTGASPSKTIELKRQLEEMGYHTAMIFVDVSEEEALRRNQLRGAQIDPRTGRAGRQVPNDVVLSKHRQAVANIEIYSDEFGQWMKVVNNDQYGALADNIQPAQKMISRFLRLPLTPTANRWIESQRASLAERLVQKTKDGKLRWALVSKSNPSKVLKWFSAQKPSDAAVDREERRVQYFKHVGESSPSAGVLTLSQIKSLENYADRLFDRLGIDVVFTNHFRDRINDPRNQPSITYGELVSFFNRALKQQGRNISELDPESQAVLKDMDADLNVPFVFNWSPEDGFTLVTKTIMRKPNFHTPNPVYQISECVDHGITSETFADFVRHTVDYLGLKQLPSISLVDRIEGQKSFAYFSNGPSGTKIQVATAGRHPADVMRSLAHELVHYRQCLDGLELDGSTGSDIENDANAKAGIILRNFSHRLFEMTAGGVAGVAVPLGGIRRRKRKKTNEDADLPSGYFVSRPDYYGHSAGEHQGRIVVANSHNWPEDWNHAIGLVSFSRLEDEIVLSDITVRPEFRRQGVGTALVSALQHHADQLGLPLRHTGTTDDGEKFFSRYDRDSTGTIGSLK